MSLPDFKNLFNIFLVLYKPKVLFNAGLMLMISVII